MLADAKFSPEQVQACLDVLAGLAQDSAQIAHLSPEQKIALMKAAGAVSRPDRQEARLRRRNNRQLKEQKKDVRDRTARAATGIRSAREASVFTAPRQIEQDTPASSPEVRPRPCYVCKQEFTTLHSFYDTMCPECAAFNYAKRFQTASLRGHAHDVESRGTGHCHHAFSRRQRFAVQP